MYIYMHENTRNIKKYFRKRKSSSNNQTARKQQIIN